jgi:polysaccharide export outer membrane protein
VKAKSVQSVAPTATALAACLALAAGCGASPEGREGTLEELLDQQRQEEPIPLAERALKVETIATAIPEQIDEYKIGANDVLNIVVLDHEEFSSPRDFNRGVIGTIVKKDGHVYIPIVGRVKADGMTVEEFHEVLRESLKPYIKEPHLSVDILKYESQKFYVLGEVRQPGTYPVDGDTTLLEAIGMAKGVTPDGNLERAYMVRGNTLLPISLADLLLKGDTSRNVYIQHQDLVYIPNAGDQTVYVIGEVKRPGAIQIKHGRLSLGQALAEVGGIIQVDAYEGKIKLIRGSWQEPTIYTLSYEQILELGDRVLLSPGDRVVVSPHGLTKLSRYMQQILPFLQGADHASRTYYQVTAP